MNKITNILGIIIIVAASYSVFTSDKIDWMDASFGIAAGAGLIYVKNNSLVDAIKKNGKV